MVKATLLGLIVASLTMMWVNRDFVTEAYVVDEDPLQVRLSGVDLDVHLTDVGPSPFAIPAAPDTRRSIMPILSTSEPIEGEVPVVEMTGGKVRLFGKVVDAKGPVGGAIVHIERITSDGVGELRVQTDAAGTYSVGQLPGGRYRVRAWSPGSLTSGGSEVRFVEDESNAEFNFTVLAVDPTPKIDFIQGGAIYAGHSGTVAVVLNRRAIDQNGIIITSPVVGTMVTVQTTPEVTLGSSPIQLTNSEGRATFTLRCAAPASGGIITVGTGLQTELFRLPGCRAVPPPPEPEPEPEPQPEPEQEATDPETAPTTVNPSNETVSVDG